MAYKYPFKIENCVYYYQLAFNRYNSPFDYTPPVGGYILNNQDEWDNTTWNDLVTAKPAWEDFTGEFQHDLGHEQLILRQWFEDPQLVNNLQSGISAVQSIVSAMQDKTITPPATTGSQTINKRCGSVNMASGVFSLVVTNSLVTVDSVIMATMATNDTNMNSVKAVPANGSFTLYVDNQPAAETRINWAVIA